MHTYRRTPCWWRWHLAFWGVPLAILLAFAALLTAPRPVLAASTINVTTTADENGAGTGCSLREAFKTADDNVNFGGCTGGGSGVPFTINLPAGTYTLTVDELKIADATNTNTSIVGAGAASTIIQQTLTNRRVIDLNPLLDANVSVSISGVTLTGGHDPSDNFGGAGIIAGGPGNTLSLSNCTITGNSNNAGTSPKGGGVEFAGGGTLNINNCTISNNTVGTAASNLGVGGGVDYQLLNAGGQSGQGGLSITNSTFSNNAAGAANSGAGGAVRVAATTAQAPSGLTISNNTFTGNQANAASNGLGGAIANASSNPVTIQFNRFFNNTATGGATGIYKVVGLGSSTNATENWWGCNAGPGNAGCDSIGGETANLTDAPRLVLSHTASPNAISVNETSALTASFLTDSAGAAVSVANISRLIGLPITFDGAVRGAISGAQATIQANGTATATFTANAAGAGSANATVDSGTATANITINTASTTTTITSDTPDPSVVGQRVTINYSVAVNAPGSGTPTGNVTVSDGTQSCTGTVAAGTCSLTFSSAGGKTLSATYLGDGSFNASTSADVAHTVNKADTTTTITSDTPDPSTTGQAVTVQYSVTANAPGSGTPTGNVTVSDGVDSCTATIASGQCAITLTTAGARTLTASYPGDANFNTSTSAAEPHTVISSATTTTITADNPDPSVVGQAVTINYTVTAAGGTPTGNVTITDGTQSCTSTVAAGTCFITFTSAGAKTLSATYLGDGSFNASTSAGVAHTVNKADTTTTITADTPDPSLVNQPVIVQYSVTVNAPGAGTPTGTVTVSDGTVSCTASVAAGQCSLTFTSAGPKTLTAIYAGDANFNGSTSAAEPHTVNLPLIVNMTVAKTHAGNFTQGQTGAQYTITASNTGSGPSSGTVEVVDTLPAGLTATAMNGTGWSCVLATLTCTRPDVLAASSSYPNILVTVNVDGNAPASVTNTAMVVGGGDQSANDNTANDPTTINAGNTSPTATVTNGQCSATNMASGTINLTLSDRDGDTLTLAYASNSNPSLVPSNSIVIGGSGNNRTLTVMAAPKKSGAAIITLNLSDGTVTVPVVITVKVGTDKNETLNGTSGIDMIFGLGGKNTINGNAGNDLLCGGNSDDTLNGGDGNDIIDGENGNDTLNGGNNNDILRGNLGNDTLTGGSDADSFSGGAGTDTATDFSAAAGDTKDNTIP